MRNPPRRSINIGKTQAPWNLLDSVVGRCVNRVHTIVYEYEGNLGPDFDSLQLEFEGCVPILLGGAGDGESLTVEYGPWKDPFLGREEENADYLETHGRSRLLELTGWGEFELIKKEPLLTVCRLELESGKTCGVQLVFGRQHLNYFNWGDESVVVWGRHSPLLERAGLTVV